MKIISVELHQLTKFNMGKFRTQFTQYSNLNLKKLVRVFDIVELLGLCNARTHFLLWLWEAELSFTPRETPVAFSLQGFLCISTAKQ